MSSYIYIFNIAAITGTVMIIFPCFLLSATFFSIAVFDIYRDLQNSIPMEFIGEDEKLTNEQTIVINVIEVL